MGEGSFYFGFSHRFSYFIWNDATKYLTSKDNFQIWPKKHNLAPLIPWNVYVCV